MTNKQKRELAKAQELAAQSNLNNIITNQNIPDDQEDDIFDKLSGYTKGIDELDEFQGIEPIGTVAKFIEDDGYIEFDPNNFRRDHKALMVDCYNVRLKKAIRLFCSIPLSADVRAGIVSDDDLIHYSFGEKTTKDGNKTLVLMVERADKVRSSAKATNKPKAKVKLSFDDLLKSAL